ncbi:integral membrane [Fusarium agapanthi]|uniref:Integral membrane n=1 Tax=Fusarium agapanthi TaxID=1803897 RepID=A0A9P5EHD5_9HYPO|nr:integral membrane [Fusarium agapanthi]
MIKLKLIGITDDNRDGRYQEKGVFDYTYALERCYATGALYIGMFEDDIILAEGWFMRILQGLSEICDSSNWLFMRLFNQERSTGWSSREIGGNNEFLIILGIDIGTAASVWFVRRHWRGSRKYLDMETLAVTAFILVPGLIVLLYQSGKASLFPPSPGVFKEPFGCCSQAMIFPRAQVPLVIDSLKERKEEQIDLMLDEIASSNGLDRYALYPVLAHYIGIDSARKTAKDEAQAIWIMAFENHNPRTLKKEQNKLLESYALWREKVEQDSVDSMYLDELS